MYVLGFVSKESSKFKVLVPTEINVNSEMNDISMAKRYSIWGMQEEIFNKIQTFQIWDKVL